VGSTLLFAGSAGAMVAVLALGVMLLVRDASREAALGQLRSGFVSGVSHELKTPLTLIRMYGEMLSDDPGAAEDERRHYCRIITRESERLTRLIDRVLGFSRLERGANGYRLERTDLMAVVRETRDDYERLLQQQGFVLHAQMSAVPPVDADPDAVREAIVNLLDNAAKYSGESREIGLHLFERTGEAVVEVRDHGVGIDRDLRPRLFEPYERGHHTGKGGYGLGLYLVKHVMTGHRGRVEVDSGPREGSRFRLVFPSATSTPVPATPSPSAAHGVQET
jgi:signal transduction histidine kinase